MVQGLPVTVVTKFGLPVSQASAPFGLPVTVVAQGGLAVTPVTSGGMAVFDLVGTLFSGIRLSNASFTAASAAGTAIGALSVVGGTGTYTFTLTNNAGNKAQVAGTNGVNLQAGSASSPPGTFPITVHATNGAGSVFDQAFTISAVQIPANTVLPVISGTTAVGQTLTTTNGTWTGFPTPTYVYQWRRGGVNIAGATLISYLLVTADIGTMISALVTATNTAGAASVTAVAVGPVTDATGTLTAPNLTWESTPDVNPPLLTIGLPTDTIAGDHVVIERSAADADPWFGYINVAVVDPNAPAQGVTAAALPNGNHVLRSRMERGAAFSPWSLSINITILVADATAPTLSSPLGSQTGQTTAAIGVTTSDDNGTLYYVVTASATPPSAAQVKAGQNNSGTAALYAGSQLVYPTAGAKTATATGLTTTGTRYAYYMHEDFAGNQSSVSSSSSWSQADIAPILSGATDTSTGSTSGTITVVTDDLNGTLYYVLSSSITPPTAAQIIAGNDDTGSPALKSGNAVVVAAGTQTINVILSASTTYYAHFVHRDAASNTSNVASADGMTTDASVATLRDVSTAMRHLNLSGARQWSAGSQYITET